MPADTGRCDPRKEEGTSCFEVGHLGFQQQREMGLPNPSGTSGSMAGLQCRGEGSRQGEFDGMPARISHSSNDLCRHCTCPRGFQEHTQIPFITYAICWGLTLSATPIADPCHPVLNPRSFCSPCSFPHPQQATADSTTPAEQPSV